MFRTLLILTIVATSFAQTVKKSPLDLLREGRMMEAQNILGQTDAPERYNLLLDALREPNAIEACFLYREISARFSGTDCDVFAQERLLQAASMGIDISSLVLEFAPATEPGQWASETPETYEVERPWNASVKREDLAIESPVVAKPVVELVQEPIAEKPAVVEESKSKSTPAESVTLDYSAAVAAKEETGIVHSSMEVAKSLVKAEEKANTEPAPKKTAIQKNTEPMRPHDIDDIAPDGWYIQVGAFGIHENAHKIATKLRADGYRVFLVPHEELLQVRVGTFETKQEGRAIGDRIKAKFDIPAVLVTVP